MNTTIEHFKIKHNQLCDFLTGMPDAFVKEQAPNKKKIFFRKKIEAFLDFLSLKFPDIKYIEDYIWIIETKQFWENYLGLLFDDFFYYDIPKSEKIIATKKDQIYNRVSEKIIEQLNSKETKNFLILVNLFSNSEIKIFAELINNKQIPEIQKFIKNIITVSWDSYNESQDAMKKLIKSFDYDIHIKYYDNQPIIFLFDYAGGKSNSTHPLRIDEKAKVETRMELECHIHELFRDISEYFWEKEISVIYFIDKNDDYFRQENKQFKQWKIIDNLQQPTNKIDSTNNGITQTKISINSDEDLEKLYQSIFS